MSEEVLQKLEELIAKAVPLPWEQGRGGAHCLFGLRPHKNGGIVRQQVASFYTRSFGYDAETGARVPITDTGIDDFNNAKLAMMAVNMLPLLIAEIRFLRNQLPDDPEKIADECVKFLEATK